MKNKYHILWVFFTIPILTELLTVNQSFSQIFNPGGYLFAVLAYSIPVILINELAIRWRLGIVGLFVLGLAYGIFNEGILAQTILMTDQRVPIAAFAGYNWAGLNLPWAATILPWHALFAVVYPIVIYRSLYPCESQQVKFSSRGLVVVTVVYFILGSFFHIKFNFGTSIHYVWLFWAFILGLIYLARRCARYPQLNWPQERVGNKCRGAGGLLIGSVLILLLIVPILLANIRVSILWHTMISLILYVCIFKVFKNKRYFDLSVFAFIAMGHYFTQAVFGFLVSKKDVDLLLGEIVVVSLLILYFVCICRKFSCLKSS